METIVRARWGLASQPELNSYGTLVFSPEAGYLLQDISGRLGEFLQQNPVEEPLWGQADTGEIYTCLDWFVVRWERESQRTTVSIVSQRVIKGLETAGTVPQFRSATFYYSHLHAWIQTPGLSLELSGDGSSIVRRLRESLFSVPLADGWSLHHTTSFSQRGPGALEPTVKFRLQDGLQILSPTPSSLYSFYEHERIFRSLISVLADRELKIEKISFLSERGEQCEVLDALLKSQLKGSELSFFNQPLPYLELGASFVNVLEHWARLNSQLNSVVPLYLLSRHDDAQTVELSFQSIMQALEGLHRVISGGKFLPDDFYENVVAIRLQEAIPTGLDRAFHDKLQSMIRYGNEYSLRKRLRELVSQLPASAPFNFARAGHFIGVSVDTRNYFAHQDTEASETAASGFQLVQLSESWQIVFLYHFLRTLGVAAGLCERAASRLRISGMAR